MDNKLLQAYISGETTEEELAVVIEWLEAEEANMRHYMTLRKLYDLSIWNESTARVLSLSTSIRLPKWIYETLKVVAVFIVAFGIAHYFLAPSVEIESMQSVYVPPGQHAQLRLSDGSKVWLNANSTLHFPSKFANTQREVRLEGEGFFEVQANSQTPFIVSTYAYTIKALGTSFNVVAYEKNPSSFETSLLSGEVEITNSYHNHKNVNNSQIIRLRPNERAIVSDESLLAAAINNPDYFMWRDGIICFEDESISGIMNKLELYFDVKIFVNNKQIEQGKYLYTGKFRSRDGLDHILNVLQVDKRFSYKKDEEKNTVEIY
ncbi:anti-sigma factor [Bacteroidales bacterium]|nr:anti-sigma factor [Bacteroidales bacterium]